MHAGTQHIMRSKTRLSSLIWNERCATAYGTSSCHLMLFRVLIMGSLVGLPLIAPSVCVCAYHTYGILRCARDVRSHNTVLPGSVLDIANMAVAAPTYSTLVNQMFNDEQLLK